MLELAQQKSFWSHLYSRAFRVKKLSDADVTGSPPSSPHHLGRVPDGTAGSIGGGGGGGGEGGPHFHHLKRTLGMGQLILMGVGGSIGAGIFVLTGVAAIDTGPAVVLSYLFAGGISVLDALCYAELASRFPLAGSVYLYTSLSFGEYPALLLSINLLFDYHIAAALIARSFATYLVKLLQACGLASHTWVAAYSINKVISFNFIAPTLLAFLTVVLCRGASHGASLNMVLTVAKTIVVLLIIVTGSQYVQVSNWEPFFPTGVGVVFTTSATVFFSYVGFDTIAASSEEVRNPRRDLPVAILSSLSICAALYMAVCLIITGMVPYSSIDPAAPLSSAFQNVGLSWVEAVISFGGVVGLATTLLVGLYAQARVYLSIARDGLVPSMLADIDPVHKTPLNAQLWCGLVAVSLATFFNVKILSELLDIGVLLAYGSVCASVLVLRSTSRTHTVRWLAVLVVTVIIPCAVMRHHGGKIVSSVLFLLPLMAIVALVAKQSYPAPTSAFSCPLVPALPLLGVLLNIYLSINLSIYAWLRFLVLVVCLSIYYVWSEARVVMGGPKLSECIFRGSSSDDAVSSSALRHRRPLAGVGGGGCGPSSNNSSSSGSSSLHRPLLSGNDDHADDVGLGV